MTTYEISYIRTGRREADQKVWINTYDKKKNGSKVHSIVDAIEYFEQLAEDWGTYETRYAITEIKVIENV